MLEQPAAMHVARIKSSHTDKQGQQREYESRLLRRTYRDGPRVRHETLANLSGLPGHVVDAVEAALKGEALAPAGDAGVTQRVPEVIRPEARALGTELAQAIDTQGGGLARDQAERPEPWVLTTLGPYP